jgi:hypothetical protein
MDDKTVNIVMRMILSPQDYERYKKGLMGIDEQLEKLTPKIDKATAAYQRQAEKIKDVQTQMNALREKAEKLQQIGMTIAMPSAAVIGAASMAMSKYVAARGAEESTARRILETGKRFEEVQIRIGRVIASTTLPFLEKAAALAEKLANFAESHPEIIDAALKIAGAGVVAGAGIGLVSQGMRVAGGIGSLMAPTVAGGTAEAAAVAAAGGKVGAAGLGAAALPAAVSVAALAIGGLIGKAIGDTINKALGQETTDNPLATAMKAWMLPGQAMAVTLKDLGVISEETAAKIGKSQKGFLDWVNGVKETDATTVQVEQSEENLKETRQKALQVQIDLLHAQHALTNAELDYKAAREKAVQQGADKVLKIETDYQNKIRAIEQNGMEARAQIVANYLEQARQAEAQYEAERAAIIRDAGIEIRRIEEDSQRRIAQMRKEWENRTRDAVQNRDALGVLQARREYEEKVQQERQTTNVEITRRREDIALRLADLQKSYMAERKQRNEAMQKVLNDQAAKEKAELETARMYYQAELETARMYQKQILAELDAFWKAQLQMLRNATLPDKSGSGSRASGGYVDAGMYRMHDKEFVLSAATTRAAESAVGGKLTQENLRNNMQTNIINLPQGGTVQQLRRIVAENNAAWGNALTSAFEAA